MFRADEDGRDAAAPTRRELLCGAHFFSRLFGALKGEAGESGGSGSKGRQRRHRIFTEGVIACLIIGD